MWRKVITYGQSAWYGPFWLDGKDVIGVLWIVVDEDVGRVGVDG